MYLHRYIVYMLQPHICFACPHSDPYWSLLQTTHPSTRSKHSVAFRLYITVTAYFFFITCKISMRITYCFVKGKHLVSAWDDAVCSCMLIRLIMIPGWHWCRVWHTVHQRPARRSRLRPWSQSTIVEGEGFFGLDSGLNYTHHVDCKKEILRLLMWSQMCKKI